MELLHKLSGLLKEAFAERHGLLNPAPEVREKLEEKGYKFEFNVQAVGRGPLMKNYTIITPSGAKIGTRHIPANKVAVARYKRDYIQAIGEYGTPAP